MINNALQQANPQVISMLGNSYPSLGGQLSQNNLSSMGVLNDLNSNDNSPFDINDFPQLRSRPNSAGGPQEQIGGSNDYGVDLHQKEQLHDNMSMMHSQHFPMGRGAGFSLGGAYSSNRPQKQQQRALSVSGSGVSFTPANNQELSHLHGADMFSSSHSMYHIPQSGGAPGIGLRPMNSGNTASGMSSYDQLMQQYQQQQNQSQWLWQPGKKLAKQSGSGSNARDSKRSKLDNFGSFFGPSSPIIAERVIQESKSFLETRQEMPRVSSSQKEDMVVHVHDDPVGDSLVRTTKTKMHFWSLERCLGTLLFFF